MKKTFNKPVLARYDIKLNENIAISWKYYQDKNQISTTYHFSQMVPGDGGSTIFGTDIGCYDYVTNNMKVAGWDTASYGGLNLPAAINLWLAQLYDAAEHNPDSTDPYTAGYYYHRCFGDNIIE